MMLRFGRRKIAVVVSLVVVYFLISPSKYTVNFDGVVNGVDPMYVWEFLSDFNNMKKLNPTILDFSITSDNGNIEKWEYGVYYTEFLSSLPFITNSANAYYKIYRTQKGEFIIDSNHDTCFVGNFMCVGSWSTFMCTEHNGQKKVTYCREDVTYECPKIFSYICFNEVMYQRRSIFKNLIYNLSKL